MAKRGRPPLSAEERQRRATLLLREIAEAGGIAEYAARLGVSIRNVRGRCKRAGLGLEDVPLPSTKAPLEGTDIRAAVAREGGVKAAARALGVSRNALYLRLGRPAMTRLERTPEGYESACGRFAVEYLRRADGGGWCWHAVDLRGRGRSVPFRHQAEARRQVLAWLAENETPGAEAE